MTKATQCSIDGCGRRHRARGFCSPHYQRWVKDGDSGASAPVKLVSRTARACQVEGCERERYVRGWCQGHYNRWRKNGDVQPDVPIASRSPRSGSCRVEGCGQPIKARLLCNGHMRREDLYGDPKSEVPLKATRTNCSVVGCEREHDGLGWCYYHREPFWRYKLTPDDFNELSAYQKSVCAICQEPASADSRLYVDHDHACCASRKMSCGKCVRGLLCKRCNFVIGWASDDVAVLQRAIDYLNSPPAKALRAASTSES